MQISPVEQKSWGQFSCCRAESVPPARRVDLLINSRVRPSSGSQECSGTFRADHHMMGDGELVGHFLCLWPLEQAWITTHCLAVNESTVALP